MAYTDLVDWNMCDHCGECLMRCPVVEMNREEASATVKRLINGEETQSLFDECRFCFNCNNYCSKGLRIHELILERALEKRGDVPSVFKYMMNGMDHLNVWCDLYEKLSPLEHEILDKWSQIPAESKDVLFVGCLGKLSCLDIENSTVLSNLPKFGPRDICCGELAYRLGSWDSYTATIEKSLVEFEKLNIERMVCYCGSCYNFLSNILPKVYEKEVPFKLISLYQWLEEKKDTGEIKLRKPLNYRAAVHESYYASECGLAFQESLRNIYRAAGVEPLDVKHRGDNNLSCGAVSSVRPLGFALNPLKEAPGRYREVRETGTRELAVHCPGCFIALSSTSSLYGIKLHYMAEDLLVAFGDSITKPLKSRIPLITGTVIKKLPGLLLKKNRQIKKK